jgi:regulatory protein
LELKVRLRKRGFDESTIGKVIDVLKGKKLVNDYAFAVFWKANRNSFNPRSRSMLGHELRQKGISPDIITRVVDELDDYESAYRAAIKRARSLLSYDYESFRIKCGGYLRRRGYD